jgi:hypothetical protein
MKTETNKTLKIVVLVAITATALMVVSPSALSALGCSRPRTHDGIPVMTAGEWSRTRDDTIGTIVAVGPVDLLGAVHDPDSAVFVDGAYERHGWIPVLLSIDTPDGVRWATWPHNASAYAAKWSDPAALPPGARLVVTFACRHGLDGARECAAMKIEEYVEPNKQLEGAGNMTNASLAAALGKYINGMLTGPVVTRSDPSCHQKGVVVLSDRWGTQVREFACNRADETMSIKTSTR